MFLMLNIARGCPSKCTARTSLLGFLRQFRMAIGQTGERRLQKVAPCALGEPQSGGGGRHRIIPREDSPHLLAGQRPGPLSDPERTFAPIAAQSTEITRY